MKIEVVNGGVSPSLTMLKDVGQPGIYFSPSFPEYKAIVVRVHNGGLQITWVHSTDQAQNCLNFTPVAGQTVRVWREDPSVKISISN